MDQKLELVRHNARTCRELAETAITPAGRDVLSSLADQYESRAVTLEHFEERHRHRRPAFEWALF